MPGGALNLIIKSINLLGNVVSVGTREQTNRQTLSATDAPARTPKSTVHVVQADLKAPEASRYVHAMVQLVLGARTSEIGLGLGWMGSAWFGCRSDTNPFL